MGGKQDTQGHFGGMKMPAGYNQDTPDGFADPKKLPMQHPGERSETMPGQVKPGASVK